MIPTKRTTLENNEKVKHRTTRTVLRKERFAGTATTLFGERCTCGRTLDLGERNPFLHTFGAEEDLSLVVGSVGLSISQ